MQGIHIPVKPGAARGFDDEQTLEYSLQQTFEEDIAKIFDESLFPDYEVVCGKSILLTHTCILKARAKRFFKKLELLKSYKIDKRTYDEIYSLISDVYTNCSIDNQESEIISYIDKKLELFENNNHKVQNSSYDNLNTQIYKKKNKLETYSTPKCISPAENGTQHIVSKQFVGLNRDYYALVPKSLDLKVLEQELEEQDTLSSAFECILRSQREDEIIDKSNHLFLKSSHINIPGVHSTKCDLTENQIRVENKTIDKPSHADKYLEDPEINQSILDHTIDLYTPDSLLTDEPSSLSDYVSAACNSSSSLITSKSQSNVGAAVTKMDKTFLSSESGIENTGLFESLNSQRDVTLTDLSLTESTLHDLVSDDVLFSSNTSSENQRVYHQNPETSQPVCQGSTSTFDPQWRSIPKRKAKEIVNLSSSKEEKQRQNEEIVILESSSLSSETGSWESVFPPKPSDKEICESFIHHERKITTGDNIPGGSENRSTFSQNYVDSTSYVQRSPFKNSCFIDAASLVDDDDTIEVETSQPYAVQQKIGLLSNPSQPVPCSTVKSELSPNDISENNDNDDSLEQQTARDSDSLQKDMSPTIFDMTPITEDSLCNDFENAMQSATDVMIPTANIANENDYEIPKNINFNISTPKNSMISLAASNVKQLDSEDGDSDSTVVNQTKQKNQKSFWNQLDHSPIVSGGASIEDHLPQVVSNTGSPYTQRKFENLPIVSGAHVSTVKIPKTNTQSVTKSQGVATWVVDMTANSYKETSKSTDRKPLDKVFLNLKNENLSYVDSKSRSSIDSDSSERSSHKFYIDLSTLPDPVPEQNQADSKSLSEKKNIFSMYIDLGNESSVKKNMPARLSSSLNAKKLVEASKSTRPKECDLMTNSSKKVKPENRLQNKENSKASKLEPTSDIPVFVNTSKNASNFEEYEALCSNSEISISEIICLTEKTSKKSELKTVKEEFSVLNQNEDSDTSVDVFVRLSDLDKPKQLQNKTDIDYELSYDDTRMTRSIPENNWAKRNKMDPRSVDVISSFHSENALSLNRLFPHLKNEFSKSMPGSLTNRTKSPLRSTMISKSGDQEEQSTDISNVSSVQSSYCRSVVETCTSEDSQTYSLINNCQSKLGQDLLRMFLEEIAPDVVIEVSGRRFKAHKCILSSRCQYFAGILSGGWVESAGNVIILPPFSYNVVQFALCHIYSGVSTIPDTVSIVELATIADMLGLEGLKEAIMFTLKVRYCHNFHKPCQVCVAGVLECFPLSSVYGLDELYRKCLKWITKHFHKVWPTKAFATLPKELLEKCYQQHVINLTPDTVVDTICACGMTLSSLQTSRWAESVARLCRRLIRAGAQTSAPHLSSVLREVASMPPLPGPATRALQDCLVAAIEWAPPEEACNSYAFLSQIMKETRSSRPDIVTDSSKQNFLVSHASEWKQRCEYTIVRSAPRAVETQAFKELPQELRKRLRELGCILYGSRSMSTPAPVLNKPTASPKPKRQSENNSFDIRQVPAAFIPYAPRPALPKPAGNGDINVGQRLRKQNPPKIRTTKAQEERAKFNLAQTSSSRERGSNKNISNITQKFENTRPRYLEPKIGVRLSGRPVSSSESSRNSSPIQTRKARASRQPRNPGCSLSRETLTASRPCTADPSTDSLSESQNSNKYATYTKVKHSNTSINSGTSVSRSTASVDTATGKGRMKTKIPVLLNTKKEIPRKIQNGSDRNSPQTKSHQGKVSCSLMMATKSSSAKVVPKATKPLVSKGNKQNNEKKVRTDHPPPEVPLMERSGTFLKDEPTFGEKTTRIDIDATLH